MQGAAQSCLLETSSIYISPLLLLIKVPKWLLKHPVLTAVELGSCPGGGFDLTQLSRLAVQTPQTEPVLHTLHALSDQTQPQSNQGTA